jgi:hypothetical protein
MSQQFNKEKSRSLVKYNSLNTTHNRYASLPIQDEPKKSQSNFINKSKKINKSSNSKKYYQDQYESDESDERDEELDKEFEKQLKVSEGEDIVNRVYDYSDDDDILEIHEFAKLSGNENKKHKQLHNDYMCYRVDEERKAKERWDNAW